MFPGLALDDDERVRHRFAIAATQSADGLPHEFDHTHSNVSGGWLRAAFGAMDGLVSNTGLIAGVAASVDAHTVILSGGLLSSGANLVPDGTRKSPPFRRPAPR